MRNLTITICVFLMPILGYALWSNWDSHQTRVSPDQNLRAIGMALHNYHAAYKTFPPPNLDGHSWRIRCNPFMISSPLFMHYDFNATWDSVDNRTIHSRPLRSGKGPHPDELVICGIPYAFRVNEQMDNHTAFLMVVGDDAFGAVQGRKITDVTDPPECTIAVVETARRDIHWLQPMDLDGSELAPTVNDGNTSISSDDPRGPLVLFVDGAVYRLNPAIDPGTLRALITVNGEEDVSRDRLIASGMLIEP
ncbi:DUF1559 family PulG-like putative transporter [Aporhodopirellula aestuarii]|uniref:DUF1559 domain-containing protein n=1 Tax=Aporhodopirellula aestuarii TaxID=2950107 RepID=A0ABT0UF44_9BACT|nr:DUF1559 domain-containing protein [Aporhodopirellula aestuarii]MCM2375260.1 DUF1559 domain-containing protein [Aporhodopirellula aestuarii]